MYYSYVADGARRSNRLAHVCSNISAGHAVDILASRSLSILIIKPE